jgi:hypothetical protein
MCHKDKCFKEQFGRIHIEFVPVAMGNDLCVSIFGGEIPHLGAVAVAQVRPSLRDPAQRSASTSVITLLGHKEDVIASRVAHDLAAKLNKNVAVCCGIHVDHISTEELEFIDAAMARFCESFQVNL